MCMIGWMVDPEALVKKFSVETPEEFVMKTKYDPDTGKQLKDKQKVVIKESKVEIKFNGESISFVDDKWQIHKAFAELIYIELGIEHEIQDDGSICFGLILDDGVSFNNIVKMNTKLEAVRKKLIKYGVPFNKKSSPVFVSYSY